MNLKEAVNPNINKDFVLKLDDGKKFFAAVAIIFKGNKVLMGKSLSSDDRKGKLVFPGGHIDGGENPYAAAKREAREETGIMAKMRALPIIEDVPEKEIEGKEGRKIAFVILDYVGGKLEPNEEFEYLEWYPLNNMPWSEVYKQNVKILKGLINKEKINLKENTELSQKQVDDIIYVAGRKAEDFLKEKYKDLMSDIDYEVERFIDYKEETLQHVSGNKVKWDEFLKNFNDLNKVDEDFKVNMRQIYPSIKI